MKFAVNYLSQFIDKLPMDLSQLSEQLIGLGIEVESVTKDHLGNDVLEIAVAPNRADLLSIIGIARELAVINNATIKLPVINMDFKPNAHKSNNFKVKVQAVTGCPKYLGAVINDIDAQKPTPGWIAEALLNAGIKLITPIVDLTNYVMLELGQPLHAFDLDQIISQELQIRFAHEGESITLLNDQKISLTHQDLIIADHNRPLAIAGIMGGKDAAISINTKNIFLECAYFEPIGIRMTSNRHNVISDASQRFTRSIDPNLAEIAIARYCDLLINSLGGKFSQHYTFINHQHMPNTVMLNLYYDKIKQLLGIEIPKSQVVTILERLGAKVSSGEFGWQVLIPSWRTDLKIQEDLIEELARHYGYHKILPEKMILPLDFKLSTSKELAFKQELKLKHCLANRGYHEVINYSFIDEGLATKVYPDQILYTLKNPISQNMRVMRPGLLPGLINNLIYNQNRQVDRIRIFEVGTVFNVDPENTNLVHETKKISALISSKLLLENWQKHKQDVDFFALKNDLTALIELNHHAEEFEFITAKHPGFHPQKTAEIRLNHVTIGVIGALHPELLLKLAIETEVYVFEVAFSSLNKPKLIQARDISKFPAIRRDFAILVDQNIQVSEIAKLIKVTLGTFLKELIFFDVYMGENLPKHKKSIAFGVVLQHAEHTLIESEINDLIQNLLINFKKHGIELRT